MDQQYQRLAEGLETEMANALTHRDQVGAMANFHRQAVEGYDQRIVDIRAAARARIADVKAALAKLTDEYNADSHDLERQIAGIEATMLADIEVAQKFQEVSRKALEVLEK